MTSVIVSRTRTTLILCLNFTFPRAWNEMTEGEKETALREIAEALGSEMNAICQEMATFE